MVNKKIKYQDQPRYPNIQTNGYEKDFKESYKKLSNLMIVNLGKKMVDIIKNK